MPVGLEIAQMTGVQAFKRQGEEWVPAPRETQAQASPGLIAVTFGGLKRVVTVAWPGFETSTATSRGMLAGPVLPPCPPGRRAHVYGKLYVVNGGPDDLAARFQKEVEPCKMY